MRDMTDNPFATPEGAYREFFRTDSAKDATGWAAVMSYPHVRVSATGRIAYYETAAEYAARASWAAREATGWVRSVGVEPVRLHESDDKVHLAGGWTRYNANDQPILRNRVTYVLTRLDGRWGIQARFGTDSFTEGEQVDATMAVGVVERHLQDWANANSLASTAFWLPLVEAGVGRVDRFADEGAIRARHATLTKPSTVGEVRTAQAGRDGVVVAAAWIDDRAVERSATFLVGKRDGDWRIAAFSVL